MKILYLVLSHDAYEVTGTPEKMFELRKKSDWILIRLYDKYGIEKKHYDYIEIIDTYKKNAPRRRFEYKGFEFLPHAIHWTFGGTLQFYTSINDIKINFGKQIF